MITIIDQKNFENISKDLNELLEINSYQEKITDKMTLL